MLPEIFCPRILIVHGKLVLIVIQHDQKIRKPAKTLYVDYVRISTVSRGFARL